MKWRVDAAHDPALVISSGDDLARWYDRPRILLYSAQHGVWLWWDHDQQSWWTLSRHASPTCPWYQYSPCTWSKEPQ